MSAGKVLSRLRDKLFSKESSVRVPERVQVTFSAVSGIDPFEAKLVEYRRVPVFRSHKGGVARNLAKRLDAVPPSLRLSLLSADGKHPMLGENLMVTCRSDRWKLARRQAVRARCRVDGELREVHLRRF